MFNKTFIHFVLKIKQNCKLKTLRTSSVPSSLILPILSNSAHWQLIPIMHPTIWQSTLLLRWLKLKQRLPFVPSWRYVVVFRFFYCKILAHSGSRCSNRSNVCLAFIRDSSGLDERIFPSKQPLLTWIFREDRFCFYPFKRSPYPGRETKRGNGKHLLSAGQNQSPSSRVWENCNHTRKLWRGWALFARTTTVGNVGCMKRFAKIRSLLLTSCQFHYPHVVIMYLIFYSTTW